MLTSFGRCGTLQVYQDKHPRTADALEGSRLMQHIRGRYSGLGPDCALFARKFAPRTAQQVAGLVAGYIIPGGDIPGRVEGNGET